MTNEELLDDVMQAFYEAVLECVEAKAELDAASPDDTRYEPNTGDYALGKFRRALEKALNGWKQNTQSLDKENAMPDKIESMKVGTEGTFYCNDCMTEYSIVHEPKMKGSTMKTTDPAKPPKVCPFCGEENGVEQTE